MSGRVEVTVWTANGDRMDRTVSPEEARRLEEEAFREGSNVERVRARDT